MTQLDINSSVKHAILPVHTWMVVLVRYIHSKLSRCRVQGRWTMETKHLQIFSNCQMLLSRNPDLAIYTQNGRKYCQKITKFGQPGSYRDEAHFVIS